MAGHPAPAAGPGAMAVRLYDSCTAEAGTALRHDRPGRGSGQSPGQVPAASLRCAGGGAARLLARRIRRAVESHDRQGHRHRRGLSAQGPLAGGVRVSRSARSAAVCQPAVVPGGPCRPLPLREHRLFSVRAGVDAPRHGTTADRHAGSPRVRRRTVGRPHRLRPGHPRRGASAWTSTG